MRASANIRSVFKNVQKKVQNTAQRRLTEQLPTVMSAAEDYIRDEQQKANFGDMTGNWLNSFGVALYRDGRFVALAVRDGQEPVRTTLIMGDEFKAGERRYDGSIQQQTFEVYKQASSAQYFANEEVQNFLMRSRSKSKGFSIRVVSIIEYERKTAQNALLRLSDEIESKGGNIWRFHL
jgi:hypothetical protein